jgi:hypothetical protein
MGFKFANITIAFIVRQKSECACDLEEGAHDYIHFSVDE